MTNEMIERVAKAIWPDAFEGDGAGWDQRRDVARQQARAAIEAMREPPSEVWFSVGATEIWRSMIDAALADPLPVFDRLTEN